MLLSGRCPVAQRGRLLHTSSLRLHRPTTVKMIDSWRTEPSSEKPMWYNRFDQVDHISQHPDPEKTEKYPPVDDTRKLMKTRGDPHIMRGWGEYVYCHYEHLREPVFPRKPDVAKGELAAGANVTRTDVWKREGEPAIQSIARFNPDNFRPVGYAENIPCPDTCVPEGHLDFRHTRLPTWHADRRPFHYFATGMFGLIGLAFLRGTVVKVVHGLWPARDAIAAGVIEVDLRGIQPGQNFVVKWRGKPVFVRRRTQAMIDAATADDAIVNSLRDPERDKDRVKKPEWLVMLGVCTHLGCVPYPDQGLYGGYFCPCHGSHYDHSGRIRLGPAPLNMEIPTYEFIDDDTIILG